MDRSFIASCIAIRITLALGMTWSLVVQNATEGDDFNPTWMADFVKKNSSFDKGMNQAVIDSGILKHIQKDALGRAGTETLESAGGYSSSLESIRPTIHRTCMFLNAGPRLHATFSLAVSPVSILRR